MFYFEHYLAIGGVHQLERASILKTTEEEWVYETIRDEILDVFPGAEVAVTSEHALGNVDLLVLPVMGDYRFPFHDVLYEQMGEFQRLVRLRAHARHVMVYRARWREAEVVASAALPALLRRRRVEWAIIRACRNVPILRRVLRPHFPN